MLEGLIISFECLIKCRNKFLPTLVFLCWKTSFPSSISLLVTILKFYFLPGSVLVDYVFLKGEKAKCLSQVIPLLAHHCSLQSLMVLFIFKVSSWASIYDFRGVSFCSLHPGLTVGLSCDLRGDALGFFDFLMVFLSLIYSYSCV